MLQYYRNCSLSELWDPKHSQYPYSEPVQRPAIDGGALKELRERKQLNHFVKLNVSAS
jgi:hypothetical protein